MPHARKEASRAARKGEHDEDQDHAVDDGRRAGRLRDVLRPERHELDEDGAGDQPVSEPRPATTTPTSRKIESATGNVSGLTYVVAIANSAPAAPA